MAGCLDISQGAVATADDDSSVRAIARHALLLIALFALVSAAYWVAVLLVAGSPGMPLDDSYIHLQYARAMHEGRWFEYNPGVRSTGTSAPLWTLMLPAMYDLTHNWLMASYLLGVLWTIPGVALTYWLALRWTGRTAWALWAAVMLVLANPTVISAYGGMEVPAYVAVFVLGLLVYDLGRTASAGRRMLCRLAGSAVFAVGVWLRPEFLLMPVLVACERMLSLRAGGKGWRRHWLAEMVCHAAVWGLLLAPYLIFNKWAAGTWLPNTYTVKAVARNSSGMVQLLAGLPTAWLHRDIWAALRVVFCWIPVMAISLVIGLLLNNAVLGWHALRSIRRSGLSTIAGAVGPAGVLALLSLAAFPLARSAVDPIGVVPFQFQRYFGHLTALMVLIGVVVLATPNRLTRPSRGLVLSSTIAAVLGLLATGWWPVLSTKNINQMQVEIARYIDQNTPADAVVATNDVGAIAFYGHRRVIDTVGLTEPGLAKWYMSGGNLEGYLRLKKPTYACMFPNWHDGLIRRPDLFEPLWKVKLTDNVICGGETMNVARTCWNSEFDPRWKALAEARAERIARRAAKAQATDEASPQRDAKQVQARQMQDVQGQ